MAERKSTQSLVARQIHDLFVGMGRWGASVSVDYVSDTKLLLKVEDEVFTIIVSRKKLKGE